VKENDFAMILGYPGRTNRWMPAGGIEQNVKFAYPAWVEGSKTGMDNMKKYMDQSAALNVWCMLLNMLQLPIIGKTVKE
jgi:hypothetical protein